MKKVEIYNEDCQAESRFKRYSYTEKTAKVIFDTYYMNIYSYLAFLLNERILTGKQYFETIKKVKKYIKSDKVNELTVLVNTF